MNQEKATIDPREVVVVVLGGGRGTRLFPLTRNRAKPAVGFGGKYRLIDIPLTNCLRSEFEKVFILTQFNSFSLNRHIWQTYSPLVRGEGFIDVVAAEQTEENYTWFQGTADAVRQSLRYILYHEPRCVLIISADQLYRMEFQELLDWHARKDAQVTIAGHYTLAEEIARLGVVGVDSEMRVTGFVEKPESVQQVEHLKVDDVPGMDPPAGRPYLCSMGIYLFNTSVLVDALENEEHDFGKSVIPMTAKRHRMSCFPFAGYWEDVGTIEAFYRANMDWRAGRGVAAFFQDGNAIITHARQLPPSRLDGTCVEDSIIADGCTIHAERVNRCIVGLRARIGPGSCAEDAILMGNDVYHEDVAWEIGRDCAIKDAIIDKNVIVGDGCRIEGRQDREDCDEELCSVRSGIVVVPRGTVIPSGTVIR